MEHSQSLLAAQYRLVQHYLDKLLTAQRIYQQGNENQTHALAIFDRERQQVEHWQAWTSHYAAQDQRAAALCSDYARACPDIFKVRLLPQEYLSWLEAALEAARQIGNRRAEATHLLEMWETSFLILEYPQVTDYAQQALAISRLVKDRSLEAQALRVWGDTVRLQGNLEEAEANYEQSLALYQAIGDQKGMANALEMLSVVALIRRDNATAQGYLEQSLVLYQTIGNQDGIGDCLNNLGYLAIRTGNYSSAVDYLEQALLLEETMGDKTGVSSTLSNLGTVAYYQGKYAPARIYFEQALAITRAIGVREGTAIDLFRLGQIMMAQGDLLKARDYFEQSVVISRSTTTGTLFPMSLSNLAIIYMQLHHEDLAYTTLHEGVEAACRLAASYVHAKPWVLIAAARVWVLRGEALQAARWLGLVENDPHPAIQGMDVQQDIQKARTEFAAALSPEQFAAAWEEGKKLDVDTVIAEILNELVNRNDQDGSVLSC